MKAFLEIPPTKNFSIHLIISTKKPLESVYVLILYYSLKKPTSVKQNGIDCIVFFGLICISAEQSLQTFEIYFSNYYTTRSRFQISFTNYLIRTWLKRGTVTTKMWPVSSNSIIRSWLIHL